MGKIKNNNKKGGKKFSIKRDLEFKEDGQEYAQVINILGNCRCECYCFDGSSRLGHIRERRYGFVKVISYLLGCEIFKIANVILSINILLMNLRSLRIMVNFLKMHG